MALNGQPGRAFRYALAVACIATVPVRAALAQDTAAAVVTEEIQSPGAQAYARAQGAWDKKEYDRAETSYQEAIEQGGLGPDEVRDAYVKLGSSRALRGKTDAAVRAFRAAAVLEDFRIPPQLKPAQARLAEQAKKDVAKMGIGTMAFALSAPANVAPARSFNVKVTIDERHVPVVSFFSLTVKESTTGKNITKQEAPKETAEIEVPAYLTPPGGQLTMHVEALDKFKNKLAIAEARSSVDATADTGVSVRTDTDEPRKTEAPKRKGVFSTPWPYVIGGVVLAGLGAAFIVQAGKADEVSIGAIGVKSE